VGDRAKGSQGVAFFGHGRAQGQSDFEVAAKQGGGVLGHAGQIGGGQAFGSGHGGHAQRQASHENAKSPHPGPQLASGQTPGQQQIVQEAFHGV